MDRIITYQPTGSIDASNCQAFQQQLMSTIRTNSHSHLLIDMKRVEFLDSAGLMVLVAAHKEAQNRGNRLSICSVSPSVQIIFELSQLDRVFAIFESRYDFEVSLDRLLVA